ncbi:hypothetical protein J2046_004587 [Rhizobium petrolearium]|nr:hypothetical protein [Neorhizobium petrolearium]
MNVIKAISWPAPFIGACRPHALVLKQSAQYHPARETALS